MATDVGQEFSEKYNAIHNKLKKRFMRKPNVSEITDEFCELGLECEHAEQPAYAGLCYMGSARCEGSIGNTTGEAEFLLITARQFMKAEIKLDSLRCINPGKENLEAALSYYSHALQRYPEKSHLNACIQLEIAENLEKLSYLHEAEVYYQKAIECLSDNPGLLLICLTNLASIFIKKEKYIDALNVYNRIDEIAQEHNYNLYIQRSEINRLLLYLIIQPSPKIMTSSLEQLLERHTIDITLEKPNIKEIPINSEVALHLQSLLMACKIGDVQTIISLKDEMKNYLSIEQKDLMRIVIYTYESMK